uniref:TERF1-interacting nuclear factor 2 N-terminal domain-containing protein n=1 Tax=Seriola lalandi dorsalis TaxID=1841481 RepID=A0A3B4YLV0_SERLL
FLTQFLAPPSALSSLVSAALWEIVKQGAVMYYGLLEEFITSVLETVPELLTYSERVQLVMGLRARVRKELLDVSYCNYSDGNNSVIHCSY